MTTHDRPAHWKDALDLPDDVKLRLPSGYDMVGDVVVVKIPEELAQHEAAVGAAVLHALKAAEVVAVDRGIVGRFRSRRLDVIAGENRTTTEISEHGVRLRMDLRTCYFSPRLSGERERVLGLMQNGETVVDLFAGVGPFALVCAKNGATAIANDANPDAVRFLAENTRRNKLTDHVHVIHGDAGMVARALPDVADRVIMNLPHNAVDFLGDAVVCVKPGGTIHLGAMVNRYEMDAFQAALPERAGGRPVAIEHVRQVRGYNPAVRHYVFDLRVG